MVDNDRFEYDIAISFVGEDRAIAETFANLLRAKNMMVLLDEYQATEPGGSDLVTHVAEIYRTKAWYCVLFISQSYPLKKWTVKERTAAQEHALRDADRYILPVKLDDTELPGITETAGYRDLRQSSMESIATWLEQKLAETKRQSGPPSKSHDLRSGNVPSNPHD